MGTRLAIPVIALAFMLAGIVISPIVMPLAGVDPANLSSGLTSGRKPDPAASGTASKQSPGRSQGRNSQNSATSVVVATAKSMDFPINTRTFATVQAPATVTIASRLSSQVTEIHVKDGQIVKKGDLMFSLDDRPLRAQLARDEAILAKDKAMLVSATSEMNRAKGLLGKSVTQQVYDAAVATQHSAQATVDADQATVDADRIQLEFTRITAPIDGRLGAIQVAVGDLVSGSSNTANNNAGGTGGSSSGAGLVTITAINPIEVLFRLPESNLHAFMALVDAGKPPRVTAQRNGSDEVIGEGVLNFIDSAVDTTSGTIAMRATFRNDDQKLWPGEYVNVVIGQGDIPDATVVPTVAVQPGQNGPFVYLVKDDNTVELRPVTVTMSNDQSAAIGNGLSPGDRVVTEGQLQLRPGAKVSTGTNQATAQAQ